MESIKMDKTEGPVVQLATTEETGSTQKPVQITTRVQKRNGKLQDLDIEKIRKLINWTANGDELLPPIKGVSPMAVERNAHIQFHDKIKTTQINEVVIDSMVSLMSEDTPNYDHMAARVVWLNVRKEAFGSNHPPHLSLVIAKNVRLGFYDKQIYDLYTEDEIDELERMIDHTRDDLFRYAGAEQMRRKYLCQNRKTRKPTESFQHPYIMVAATLFASYPKEERMALVKEYYDYISTHDLNEPTPVMAGVRTGVRQYSSCVVMSSGDSLDSIERTGQAILRYASKKAGIGIDGGRIRAVNQPIRGGEAISTGQIPFIKKFNGDLKSSAQGGVRGASATYNFPFWHLEFESLIELKNEKGTEETRVRTMDYVPHLNRIVFERFDEGRDLTLFSPEDVPDLWDAFYSPDYPKFKTLYEQYEKKLGLTKKTIPALEVMNKVVDERFEVGRIYPFFADTVNRQTPFYQPVTLTNLCVEICLPTLPLSSDPTEGSIALCTLGAINVGKLGDLSTQAERDHLARICEMGVRAKDKLLSYQDYPLPEAKRNVEDYRPLGFGIIGLAHWLAKLGVQWGHPETIAKVNELMELISYNLILASVKLAEEFGPCRVRTKYADGWMPFDDSPLSFPKTLDWDGLRKRAIAAGGTRNGTLMAFMPSETSSQLANETNGVEPPTDLITVKDSKDGSLPQVVPEYAKLNHLYETRWNISVENYLYTLAPIQHYNDQSISANTNVHLGTIAKHPESERIRKSEFLSHMILAYKLGYKTLYYSNLNTRGDIEDDGCAGGACKI